MRLECDLTGSRAKETTFSLDEVSEIDKSREMLKRIRSDDVLSQVDLDRATAITQMAEDGAAHIPHTDDPPGYDDCFLIGLAVECVFPGAKARDRRGSSMGSPSAPWIWVDADLSQVIELGDPLGLLLIPVYQ